jgi:tRNA(Arg) A34 adenosine deaminase TadA
MARSVIGTLDSYRAGGIPIGAVLVADGEIIGRGHNRRVQEGNPILHGELSAYRHAGRLPSAKYRRATLYTTRSPCSMCAGTTLLYGVPRIVIGEARPMCRDFAQICPRAARGLGRGHRHHSVGQACLIALPRAATVG